MCYGRIEKSVLKTVWHHKASMIVKTLTEHHLEFLSLKEDIDH